MSCDYELPTNPLGANSRLCPVITSSPLILLVPMADYVLWLRALHSSSWCQWATMSCDCELSTHPLGANGRLCPVIASSPLILLVPWLWFLHASPWCHLPIIVLWLWLFLHIFFPIFFFIWMTERIEIFFFLVSAWFVACINALVHVVMYSYYALSLIPSLKDKLWWKKYITKIQLVSLLLYCQPSFYRHAIQRQHLL